MATIAMGVAAQVPPPRIVPSGATQTHVTTRPDQRQVVTIAPPRTTAAVSLNRYTEFGVGVAGATVDNSQAARLIVNEVIGTSPSRLLGELLVEGPRANLILANPNGIVVNGGSVRNAGSVTLATAPVKLLEFATGGGTDQADPTLQVRQGEIVIQPGGLSGAFTNLDLVASSIRVDGPIINEVTGPDGKVKLIAGAVDARYDASLSPVDERTPWGFYSRNAGDRRPRVAIEVTGPGGISAGRVDVVVTDAGAGVRHAGDSRAATGDFVISADGHIDVGAGSIAAGGDILLAAERITATAVGSGPVRMEAARDVQLLGQTVELRGATVSAGAMDRRGNVILGIPDRPAVADLLLSTGGGGGDIPTTITATGAAGLFAPGRRILISGATVAADLGIRLSGNALDVASIVDGSRTNLARLESAFGFLELDFIGSITLAGAAVSGGAGLYLRSPSISSESVVSGQRVIGSELRSNGGSVVIVTPGSLRLEDTSVLARRNAVVTAGGDVVINQTAAMEGQAGVIAVEGILDIRTDGTLTNDGGLLRGGSTLPTATPDAAIARHLASGGVLADQAVSIRAGRDFLNRSRDRERLGIVFAERGDLLIDAGGEIRNTDARLIANGGIRLQAQGNITNESTVSRDVPVVTHEAHRHRVAGVLRRHERRTVLDFGQLSIPGELGFIVADGGIHIDGQEVINRGGEINANGGEIRIHAAGTVINEALRTGQASLETRCFIFCRGRARGRVQVIGGTINASEGIYIRAHDGVRNMGGSYLGLGEIVIDAPYLQNVSLQGVRGRGVYGGLLAKLGSNPADLEEYDEGGSIRSIMGGIHVAGDYFDDGGILVSMGTTRIDGERRVRRARYRPDPRPPALGWLWRFGR